MGIGTLKRDNTCVAFERTDLSDSVRFKSLGTHGEMLDEMGLGRREAVE
jgi:hypothetical protein